MLPIDIVIPSCKRIQDLPYNFISQFLLEGIDPACIQLVTEGMGNANVKRNLGAKRGKQPYIFFCDDDITLEPGILAKMYDKLTSHYGKAYCYCDFNCINHPLNGNFTHRAGEFDAERLRTGNPYISTMSLMYRSAFNMVGGFDEKIERLQDYDLFLSMLKQGLEGIYLPEIGFTATYSEDGITKREGYSEAWEILRRKHSL